MSHWDVFESDTLELQRGLSTLQVQAALAAGDLREDDLARPADTKSPWLPIGRIAELALPGRSPQAPAAPSPPSPAPPSDTRTDQRPERPEPASESDVAFPVVSDDVEPGRGTAPETEEPADEKPRSTDWTWSDPDDEDEDELSEVGDQPYSPDEEESVAAAPAEPAEQWELDRLDLHSDLGRGSGASDSDAEPSSRIALPVAPERSSQVALPTVSARDWSGAAVGRNEEADEEEAFTFARRSVNKIEELDLAPMVDVAFQLVLFFMVTATTVLYKTLEIPKPSRESAPDAVAQGRSKSVDDLRDAYIVVEIDAAGSFKIDREPIAADVDALIERLRDVRDKTARKSMLLSADYATPHRFAVLAIDAANEIGLGIAVARPKAKPNQAPTPSIFPLNPRGRPAADGAGA